MAIRNTPSTTPQRVPRYVPPSSIDGSDRGKLLQAQEAQRRAQTRSYTPWTGGGNASFVAPPGAAPFVEYGVDRSGDRMGGNLTFGGGGGVSQQEEAPTPRLSDFRMPDFRDAEYNAQIASLNRTLQNFETGAQQRGERYGIDYLQGVRNIGYRPAPGFVAMPNILEAAQEGTTPAAARAVMGSEQPDPTANLQGQWDLEGRFDPYSAAARGTRGTRDEFAARGTLRSSDFGKTFGEFQNRLNEQLGAMETGRTRFSEDLSRDVAQQRAETEERRQAAERAAINRAATAQMNAYLQALAAR